jgi:hypothetical protein
MANEIVVSNEELGLVKQTQSVLKTSYDDRVLVNLIGSSIALPKQGGVQATFADVLSVLRISSSMHLDPVLGGIYSFKNKDGSLICGVSLKGYRQALHSQPDYAGIEFKYGGELKTKDFNTRNGKVTITYYDSITCLIKKRHGEHIDVYEGTAYFDEEFDVTKTNTWLQRPKRMLSNRALTIACANAYGWGAYDEEEVRELAHDQAPVQVQANVIDQTPKQTSMEDRALKSLGVIENEDDPLSEVQQRVHLEVFMEQMRKCVNRKDLVALFKSAPDEIKKNQAVIDLGKELTSQFGT